MELIQSIQTGLIDQTIVSSKDYQPQLIYNDKQKGLKLSYELNHLLRECDTFYFSVAFINKSGLAVLKQALLELQKNNKKGKLITSTYLGFNHPDVFEELLTLPCLDVRIYEDEGFHPKGYIFQIDDLYKVIVGSSNMTQTALNTNQEWNMSLTCHKNGSMIVDLMEVFEQQWKHSTKLTQSWIDEYRKDYVVPVSRPKRQTKKIKPNYMQECALQSLKALRKEKQSKALLISATGTGKTYLAAFDVKAYQPKRLLFVVHRRSIAIQAKETFEKLMPNISMGLYSGSQRDKDKQFLFATVQTISKAENYNQFKKDEFDYIIIDEVHKAGANSYQELMRYFQPKFMLGMSATPERNDGFDIYSMFDHNIAFEIRLQHALQYDLLCPFHYYGITDLIIDGQEINDKTDFNRLVNKDRVDYIVKMIKQYGHCGEQVCGLIFVSRKDEAKRLSEMLNERGYCTLALTGENTEDQRQQAMNDLENHQLDYIITVDIFNEGIDIPKVNQVVMLRPTESAIIFVQQLGRGLRKVEGKDYVVVIDFIGNYEKNYLIPIALSGQEDYDKDHLRRFITEPEFLIYGSSSVQFDEVSRKKIYESIDVTNFNDIRIIKDSYFQLKNKLGRIPHLKDFETYGAIDVQRIFQNKSLGSYYTFLKKYDHDYKITLSSQEELYLKFISTKLGNGKRLTEIKVIRDLMKKNKLRKSIQEDIKEMTSHQKYSYETVLNILSQNFMTGTGKKTYSSCQFIKDGQPSKEFMNLLKNDEFVAELEDLLGYIEHKYQVEYSNPYLNTDFCLYKKYTYDDVCRLMNWEKALVPINIGGYYYDKRTNTLPVFINYDKAEDIQESIKYEDHFIDSHTIIAMSKNNRSLESESMKVFTESKQNNTSIHLFVRKNKDDKVSKEFYYLGLMTLQDIQEEELDGKPICELTYHLEHEVRKDIYDYIVS